MLKIGLQKSTLILGSVCLSVHTADRNLMQEQRRTFVFYAEDLSPVCLLPPQFYELPTTVTLLAILWLQICETLH